ncbi:ThrRS/AlaRS common domain-containing protein [Aaosphaeria arxii CBS 175.79]|uniref:ThrRS/AlaRS common domain-containing protein n=1 Tax=Aaosphaeria arxii CBS 175.79 TaxID=1450172 RepID=A0A6A5XRJ6_9PLEO|nr:ThrRS/AlaRS common domain-containing protein [Aaosphaeria arxii CBS 175.79]KAF2015310.1 ThrRS/AlaRS common domain-containing protein [Aaosphaeria arxii CBS 175.79]
MASLTQEKTEALYQKDGTLSTHSSTVGSVEPLSSLPTDAQSLFKVPEDDNAPYILTTPSTIFHAQGGGQPSDTGTIKLNGSESTFHVHQVRKTPTIPAILHLGTFAPPAAESDFKPSTSITQEIDLPKRILHSRLHTAGHVLGLAINILSKSGVLPADIKDGKASHYPGMAFVECFGLIPGTAKAAIQQQVDELVSQDLPVKIHFWGKEEASKKCVTGIEGAAVDDIGDDEGVRVVEIGDVGSYPCGGTHVLKLKECGKINVRTIKRQKGITKISYEVQDA